MLLFKFLLASLLVARCYCKGVDDGIDNNDDDDGLLIFEMDMDDESMAYIYMEPSKTNNIYNNNNNYGYVNLFINGTWSTMIPLQKDGYATINLLQPGIFEICDLDRHVTRCSSPLAVSWEAASANMQNLITTIFYTEN